MIASHHFLTGIVAFGLTMGFGWVVTRADDMSRPRVPPPFHGPRSTCQLAEEVNVRFMDPERTVSKLRKVSADKAGHAVDVFKAQDAAVPFNQAWLADVEGGGGFLMVGMYDYVCARIALPPDKWKALLADVDGDGS